MDFSLPEYLPHGLLQGDDLTFFYYDIGQDTLQGWPDVYEWNKAVLKFKGAIDIKECDTTDIPDDFQDNVIRFTVSDNPQSDNGNIASAFFRHLRNAFAHYRIVQLNGWYEITDYNGGGEITMRARIKVDLLQQFCFCFFDQRETIINSFDSSPINPLNYE